MSPADTFSDSPGVEEDRRRAPRLSVSLEATIRFEDRVVHAHLFNLSRSGTLVETPTSLPVGRACMLEIVGFDPLPATVVRSSRGYFGLRFRPPSPTESGTASPDQVFDTVKQDLHPDRPGQ